ncbi:hypothetical protein SMB34_11765 [Thalassospira permensis NBRC 106175]|uniref:Uncharacterized protein n=1 Tax=Thalassospira permensis NBRC 106175 TaxID=1353532 RepID=A0ABR4TSW7_9PROT|nr:hypothetical protein SMB34_11765 [Thalassospira permensis NBRC 106175]
MQGPKQRLDRRAPVAIAVEQAHHGANMAPTGF